MADDDLTNVQRATCERYGVTPCPSSKSRKVGISKNVRAGMLPINGLRHRPEGDTTGWYIWAGESLSSHPEFFVPLHVEHLAEWCPSAMAFLALPPGWRFLLAPDHEDVWFDESLV